MRALYVISIPSAMEIALKLDAKDVPEIMCPDLTSVSICGEVYEFDCVAFNTDLVPVKCAEKENIIIYTNYLSAT